MKCLTYKNVKQGECIKPEKKHREIFEIFHEIFHEIFQGKKFHLCTRGLALIKKHTLNKFVRPRWPYDMRPSARAEMYMCVIVIR